MKKILVLIATAITLASCSNASDDFLAIIPMEEKISKVKETVKEPEPVSVVYTRTGEINKTSPVDFEIEVSDEYREVVPNELGVNWVFIASDVWEEFYKETNGKVVVRGKDELLYKPVLKIESDSRGIIFCNTKGYRDLMPERYGERIISEWAYKCIVYAKNSDSQTWGNGSSGFIYNDSEPTTGYGFQVADGKETRFNRAEKLKYFPW